MVSDIERLIVDGALETWLSTAQKQE